MTMHSTKRVRIGLCSTSVLNKHFLFSNEQIQFIAIYRKIMFQIKSKVAEN